MTDRSKPRSFLDRFPQWKDGIPSPTEEEAKFFERIYAAGEKWREKNQPLLDSLAAADRGLDDPLTEKELLIGKLLGASVIRKLPK